ncbi:chemokine XC receptor 1-like [Pristis pectinata]|uniref:chemokine XC receptor 1-like n=1 Tax=Pristis pectinata TaxID=685728 RepID=UPI00223DB27B|nr:chemokine XC receptor 1-like [Pristis pectinata]
MEAGNVTEVEIGSQLDHVNIGLETQLRSKQDAKFANRQLSFINLIGNILALWILVKYEKPKTITDIFILNLGTSDLLFTCSLPFWTVEHTHGWIFGKAMCKIITLIFFVGYYSGILLLTLMTVDRYFAVVHALPALRIRKLYYGVVACLVAWCISILATVPEMIFADIIVSVDQSFSCGSIYPKGSELRWQLSGYYQQNILFFLIPFIVIVLSYYKIFNTVVKCKARRKHKTVKVIFCIVMVFFLCWAPYNIILFIFSLSDLQVLSVSTCTGQNRLLYAYFICRSIAYFHCCLNPFFYAFVGTKFREHLISVANKRFPYLKACTEINSSSTKQNSFHNYSDFDLHLQTALGV